MRISAFLLTILIFSRIVLGGAELRVRLVNNENKPVAKAQATLKNTQSGEEKIVESNNKGTIDFGKLPPGVYVLEAGAKEHVPAKTEPLTVSEKDIDLMLTLAAEKPYREVEEAGNAAHNQREYSEALKHYKKAVKMAPQNPVAWSNLARAYAGVKDLNNAAAAARKAAALEPYQFERLEAELHGWMMYEEGWDYLERHEFEKAIEILTESAARAPESANTFYALAVAHAYQGKNAQALQHVDQALKLKPGDAEALNLKLTLEERVKTSNAP